MAGLKHRTKYPLSVDCVVFGYTDEGLKVALIERDKTPYQGTWAIPGGFLIGDESVEEAAFRELAEETGLQNIYLEQFHVFSHSQRDPCGRVITVAFFALIRPEHLNLSATADARQAIWWPAYTLPQLAFDHADIYAMALQSLRKAMIHKPLAFELLPKKFTLSQLQKLYEEIFNLSMDKRNFRKKIQKMAFIQGTGKTTIGGRHRPAALYRFDVKTYMKSANERIF